MTSLSNATAYHILWTTYAVLLVSVCVLAYRGRNSASFISANGTRTAIPLALNFVASGIGCGSLSALPQVANIDGIHGLLVYALAGALPMFVFAFLGPVIKRKTPSGFVLTEWVFQRFGLITGWYLSMCTMLTVFLFMVSDIAALKYAISSISNVNPAYFITAEAVVTTIYTSIGGFRISFITDSLQVAAAFLLLVVISCTMGAYIEIDKSKIYPSGLLKTNKLGWQLVYILTLAIFTNDFFMSGFWLRTFAARNNRDLLVGCSIACVVLTVFSIVIGFNGLLAVWAGFIPVADKERSGAALFILLSHLPSPLIGLTLIFIITLSTFTFDSLQSAMVSSISNDLFRNKISIMYTRLLVLLVMIPVVIVGLAAEDILKIYLFVDLLSSSVVPVLVIGLRKEMDNYWTSWEVIGGGFGGLICVWIFGAIYYQSIQEGFSLLFISKGLYVDDWSTFGAFVAAPAGAISTGYGIMHIRLACKRFYADTSSQFHVYSTKAGEITGLIAIRRAIAKWEITFLGPVNSIQLNDNDSFAHERLTRGHTSLDKLRSPTTFGTNASAT